MLLAESREELQVKVDELGNFCSKWELVVGIPKTRSLEGPITRKEDLLLKSLSFIHI